LEGLSGISAALGLAAVVVSIALNVSTLRRRASEPNEKRWRAFEEWKKEVDEKLARDYRSLNEFAIHVDDQKEFRRIMLMSIRGILRHLSTGNGADEMKAISDKIDQYLIE
jgi:hypothetical protein